MRLNQKGFAVSTILYGLLLVMVFIIFLLLSVNRFERRTTNDYVELISKELNECVSAYSAKYEPLELCKDTGDKYSWVSGTWPWEEQ